MWADWRKSYLHSDANSVFYDDEVFQYRKGKEKAGIQAACKSGGGNEEGYQMDTGAGGHNVKIGEKEEIGRRDMMS